jgi:hypothetical protein
MKLTYHIDDPNHCENLNLRLEDLIRELNQYIVGPASIDLKENYLTLYITEYLTENQIFNIGITIGIFIMSDKVS